MTLSLEVVNRYETNVVNTAAECVELIGEIGHPSLRVHLDTYHMNIEERSMREAVEAAGELLGYVHIGESHRGYLGTGTVDFAEFFAALAAGGALHAQAVDTRDRALSSPWASERARLNGEIERYESSAWLAAGVGTAALLGGALWFTLDVPLTEERYQPPLRVQLGPNGVKLEASFD